MGFMGWIVLLTNSEKFYFTLLNSSMPILVLTIANSDGVHVMTKFFKEIRKLKDKDKAIKSTMDTLMLPIFITSLTTVAAFCTLIWAPLNPLTGYGLSIGFGIVWAWILSITLLPSSEIIGCFPEVGSTMANLSCARTALLSEYIPLQSGPRCLTFLAIFKTLDLTKSLLLFIPKAQTIPHIY